MGNTLANLFLGNSGLNNFKQAIYGNDISRVYVYASLYSNLYFQTKLFSVVLVSFHMFAATHICATTPIVN